MPKQKSKPLSAQQQQDVDFLSNLFANGISGLIQIGISDGLKMKQALDRVTKSQAGVELMAAIWSRFWNVNPQAATAIELAAAMNPALAGFFEKMKMKAKEIPPEDVNVHEEKS